MGFKLNTDAKAFQPRKPTPQEEEQMQVNNRKLYLVITADKCLSTERSCTASPSRALV